MRSRLISGMLALLTLTAATVACAALGASNVTLPTWPQSFAISAGGRASFGFPVTKNGKVVVDVTWAGKPLSVVLLDWQGRPVSDTAPRTSPVHIEYDAANVDASSGFIWTVAISDPGQAPKGNAQAASIADGRISVQYPDVNLGQFTPLANALNARRLSTLKSAQDRLAASLRPQGQAPKTAQGANPQLQSRIKSLEQTEAAQFSTIADKIKAGISPLPKMSALSSGGLRTTVKSRIDAKLAGAAANVTAAPETITPPTLLDLTNLDIIYAGDEGYARVRDVPDDTNLTQICFQMTPTTVAKAEVISASRVSSDPSYGPHVVFRIRVPEEVPGMQDVISGMKVFARNVSAKNPDAYADGPPVKRNVLYICRRPPEIDKVDSPQLYPSQDIEITGTGMRKDSVLHFVFPDGRDVTRTKDDDIQSRFKTYTPSYRSVNALPAIMYIDDVIHGRPVRSNLFQVTFAGTEPIVNSITPTHTAPQGPPNNEWIVLRGTGLKRIHSIRFEPDLGQESKILTHPGDRGDFRA